MQEPTDYSSTQSHEGRGIDEYREQLEQFIRDQPLQAALAALAAGFVLTKLPIRSLLSVLIGLVLFSIKPALLISGAIKLFEEGKKVRDQY